MRIHGILFPLSLLFLVVLGCKQPKRFMGPPTDVTFSPVPNLYQFGNLCARIKSHPLSDFTPTQGLWQWWDLKLTNSGNNYIFHLHEMYTGIESSTIVTMQIMKPNLVVQITVGSKNNKFFAEGTYSTGQVLKDEEISIEIGNVLSIISAENDKVRFEYRKSH